ncbi:MAG: M28 family metallopeptidase [Janthinobacterium lividum]
MKLKYILFLSTIFCGRTFAQTPEQLISKSDVERIIKTLTADDMQGRATFTPGIEKAAKFIETEYKNIGLLPLPGNQDFRQNFSMFRSKAVQTSVSVNNTIVPKENIVAISGAASFDWSNNADVEVVKISAEKNLIAEYRKIASSNKKTLALVDPHFEALFKRIAVRYANGDISKEINPNQQLVFVLGDFTDVKAYTVKYTGKVEKLPLFNVAGMLPGKTKKEEYVVFSGHYDHLGIIKAVEGDSIANGADDDASGTTAVIELAKYYKKLNNNERTLIFVAFTAEEIGEFGSAYFATQINPEKTIAMFNIEMIGKTSKFGANTAFITGFERSDFGTILQKNLDGTSFKFYPDPYPEQNLFYRSDNASLARVGVPAHTISTDQIDSDKLYHTVKDELSSLDVNNITATIRAIALSSRSIVAGNDTPKRIPKLEE